MTFLDSSHNSLGLSMGYHPGFLGSGHMSSSMPFMGHHQHVSQTVSEPVSKPSTESEPVSNGSPQPSESARPNSRGGSPRSSSNVPLSQSAGSGRFLATSEPAQEITGLKAEIARLTGLLQEEQARRKSAETELQILQARVASLEQNTGRGAHSIEPLGTRAALSRSRPNSPARPPGVLQRSTLSTSTASGITPRTSSPAAAARSGSPASRITATLAGPLSSSGAVSATAAASSVPAKTAVRASSVSRVSVVPPTLLRRSIRTGSAAPSADRKSRSPGRAAPPTASASVTRSGASKADVAAARKKGKVRRPPIRAPLPPGGSLLAVVILVARKISQEAIPTLDNVAASLAEAELTLVDRLQAVTPSAWKTSYGATEEIANALQEVLHATGNGLEYPLAVKDGSFTVEKDTPLSIVMMMIARHTSARDVFDLELASRRLIEAGASTAALMKAVTPSQWQAMKVPADIRREIEAAVANC